MTTDTAPPARPSRSADGVAPYALFAASLAAYQVYFYAARSLGSTGGLLAYLALQGFLVLFLVGSLRWTRVRAREAGFVLVGSPGRTALLSLALSAVYVGVLWEPGLLLGFTGSPALSAGPAAFVFASAPLLALGQVGIFQGVVLRQLARRSSFLRALYVSSLLFALHDVNLLTLPSLDADNLVRFLLTVVATGFVLGVLLGWFFFRSGWSLFGPFLLLAVLTLEQAIVPVAPQPAGWDSAYVMGLVAYAVLILLVALLVPVPSSVARRMLGETPAPQAGRLRRRAERGRAVARAAVTAAALAAAVIVMGLAAQAVLGPRTPFLAVASGSMEPALHRGDLVVVQRVAPESLVPGDVIAFESTCLPSPVIHRVVGLSADAAGAPYLVTRGDANPSPDLCPVHYADVVGRVAASLPVVGHFVLNPLLTVGALGLLVLSLGLRTPKRRRVLGRHVA